MINEWVEGYRTDAESMIVNLMTANGSRCASSKITPSM